MARHFTAANIANGYAAMGKSRKRPHFKNAAKRSVKEAILAEARKAARMANAAKSKSK